MVDVFDVASSWYWNRARVRASGLTGARLESALASGILSEPLAKQIVKTARVTARLYALQLEEIDVALRLAFSPVALDAVFGEGRLQRVESAA